MKNGIANTTETESDESRIIRESPNEYGIVREIIWEKKIRDFQEHVEEEQKTTVMDVVAGICPELVRRLTEIANLLR